VKKSILKPQVLSTDGSRQKNSILYDPRNANQRKRFVELAFYKFEFIRRKDKYRADYKKYFHSALVVYPSADNQSILNYFKDTYDVSIPINPDYSFREIYKQSETEWESTQLTMAFLQLFFKYSIQSPIITTLTPIFHHHLTQPQIVIKKIRGRYKYFSISGKELPAPDLLNIDITDMTIRINLAAPNRKILEEVRSKITLYQRWYKGNSLIKPVKDDSHGRRFKDYKHFLRVYDFINEGHDMPDAAKKFHRENSYNNRKKIEYAFNRAKDFIDGEYRKIA
jgi:hypothetical protein